MPEDGKIAAFKAVLDRLPTWAVILIIIGGGLAAGAWWTYEPAKEILTLREANETLNRTISEFTKHIGEVPKVQPYKLFDENGESMTVAMYRDKCLLQERVDDAGRRLVKLVIDPARDEHKVASNGWMVTVEAASQCDRFNHGRVARENRSQQGQIIYFHRSFQDGCEHIQAFDIHGIWFEPRWLVCRH